MTFANDSESQTPMLHYGSVGGYTAVKLLGNTEAPSAAPWNSQVEDIRERFDIDRDLGGLAVSRVWGVTSTQGLVAAAITLHPGDMVEYRTNAEERLTIVFSTANGEPQAFEHAPFLCGSPTNSIEFLTERRDTVLDCILGETSNKHILPSKILYAAACCAIVQSQSTELIANARRVFERLSATKGVDMTEEIAKSSEPGNTIEAKSADALNTSGVDMFEMCGICGAGIAWYSAQEAQCATGHVFGMLLQAVWVILTSLTTLPVRCNLTFLAIQEPGISKFCSKCESEYLDEDQVGYEGQIEIHQPCKRLSRIFDTCIYCHGKFRP